MKRIAFKGCESSNERDHRASSEDGKPKIPEEFLFHPLNMAMLGAKRKLAGA